MLDALAEGVYLVDPRRTIRFWNKASERISGYAAADVVGHHCFENILRHVDDQGQQLCFVGCPLHATMRDGNGRSCRMWLHHRDGRRIPVQVRTTPIRDNDSRIIGAIEFFTDESVLTTAQERAAELEHLVLTDPLTELPNRRYLDIAVPSRLEEARRYEQGLGVAFVDIDHFKAVNDRYGHETGDKALRMVAGTLAANLRTSDIICRFGGEEFVLLFTHNQPAELEATCERLITLVGASSLDIGHAAPLSVTISIGATAARPGDDPDSLLSRADELLYRSKQDGRNRVTCDAPPPRSLTPVRASALP